MIESSIKRIQAFCQTLSWSIIIKNVIFIMDENYCWNFWYFEFLWINWQLHTSYIYYRKKKIIFCTQVKHTLSKWRAKIMAVCCYHYFECKFEILRKIVNNGIRKPFDWVQYKENSSFLPNFVLVDNYQKCHFYNGWKLVLKLLVFWVLVS